MKYYKNVFMDCTIQIMHSEFQILCFIYVVLFAIII